MKTGDNKTPGTRERAEGFQDSKTNTNVSPNTPEPGAGLALRAASPKIKLTPLRYHGQFWGWLARTDKDHFCWGLTKQQAWHRLAAALRNQADERK